MRGFSVTATASAVEQLTDRPEVRRHGLAEMVEHERRVAGRRGSRLLAVEQAQRVLLEAALAVVAQRAPAASAEAAQRVPIGGTAARVAERVELDLGAVTSRAPSRVVSSSKSSGVDERVVAAEHLGADLRRTAAGGPSAAARGGTSGRGSRASRPARARASRARRRRAPPTRCPPGAASASVPSRSSKVYISFSTMSVVSPIGAAKSSVRSTIGMRISA